MRLYLSSGTATVPKLLALDPHLSVYIGWLNVPRSSMSFETLRAVSAPHNLPIACDNSAFTYFDESRYCSMLRRAENVDVEWVTLPDVVADAERTTTQFYEWCDHVPFPRAYVGQDGCEDLEIPWDLLTCFFIGGSTEWKLSQTAADLIKTAKTLGKHVHMGRVNSQKRLRYAYSLGVDSVDGSGYSKWIDKYLPPALHYLHTLHTDPQLNFLEVLEHELVE